MLGKNEIPIKTEIKKTNLNTKAMIKQETVKGKKY